MASYSFTNPSPTRRVTYCAPDGKVLDVGPLQTVSGTYGLGTVPTLDAVLAVSGVVPNGPSALVIAPGQSTSLVGIGSGLGNIPQVPMPMSALPAVKARIDVHPFSITVGPTARRSGHVDLMVPPGLSNYFNVVAYQSALPGINKGIRPDSREFDQILMTADITSDTTLRCSWVATGPIIGNFGSALI